MKKLLVSVLALAMVFSLAACGSSGAATTAKSEPAAAAASAASEAAASAEEVASNAAANEAEAANAVAEAAAAANEAAGDLGEPVTLKLNNFGPEAVPFGLGMVKAKEYIEEASGGNITITIYNDGTLLGFGDTYQGVNQKVADLGIVGPAATDSVVTLNSIFTTVTPYLPADTLDVFEACYDMLNEVPELQEEMIQTAGVRWVGFIPLFGSNIHCKGITPKTPDDMKGVSIEALGGVCDFFSAMGANAMTLDPADYYIDMERGVIDAQATHWPVQNNYAMHELTTYHLCFGADGGGFMFGTMGVIMNEEVWESLTEAQQQIIMDGFREGCKYTVVIDKDSAAEGLRLNQEEGDEFVYLSTEEELAPWLEYMEAFNDAWCAKVDAAGWDGTGTMEKFHEILSRY